MVGEKQSGMLHPNLTGSSHLDEQPSLIYHFQVPMQLLKQKQSIYVRLQAHSGQFVYAIKQNSIPIASHEELYGNKSGTWLGFEYKDVEIKESQLVQNQTAPAKQSVFGPDQEMLSFYVRVWPYIDLSSRIWKEQNKDKDEKPIEFHFDIAFYDEEKSIRLVNGIPQRGVVTSEEFDYFYFDVTNTSLDYEITLSQISGSSADVVLSLNPENKFPTVEHNDFHSISEFTTDSMVLTSQMFEQAR